MESLYKTHQYLLENIGGPLRRKIMDEIDWTDRLIAIQGSRGVGRTNILIQYAREHFEPTDRKCLYINLNNLCFTVRTIRDFANEFRMKGGKVLLIDQIFKYQDWAEDLAYCYDNYPELQIVFTMSSVLQLEDDHYHLKDKVTTYYVRGFSFREFIELKTGIAFNSYSIEEIIESHEDIVQQITSQIHPLAYYDDYLRYGFYPFHLEKHNFLENILNVVNTIIEVDVLNINQIEQTYLPKIRKLLYLLTFVTPSNPNISQLSLDIETSRATVMNYIKYLKDAKLVSLLYAADEDFPKKPSLLYPHNTNLYYAIRQNNIDPQALRETFFFNQLYKGHPVNLGVKDTQFLVDNKYSFNVGDSIKGKFNKDCYYAIDGIERGEKKVIPLWLFGFLY